MRFLLFCCLSKQPSSSALMGNDLSIAAQTSSIDLPLHNKGLTDFGANITFKQKMQLNYTAS